jgi:hypothetical protein
MSRPFVPAVILLLLGVLGTGSLQAAGARIKGYFTWKSIFILKS